MFIFKCCWNLGAFCCDNDWTQNQILEFGTIVSFHLVKLWVLASVQWFMKLVCTSSKVVSQIPIQRCKNVSVDEIKNSFYLCFFGFLLWIHCSYLQHTNMQSFPKCVYDFVVRWFVCFCCAFYCIFIYWFMKWKNLKSIARMTTMSQFFFEE
jgi:hypothetical protein